MPDPIQLQDLPVNDDPQAGDLLVGFGAGGGPGSTWVAEVSALGARIGIVLGLGTAATADTGDFDAAGAASAAQTAAEGYADSLASNYDAAGAATTAQANAESYTDSELAAHMIDVDPHGDRAYADSLASNYDASGAAAAAQAAAESYADSLASNYDAAGDAAAAQTAAESYADAAITTHVGASDPHGDRAYANSLFASNDALLFKGVIDCSGNPNYPAADAGHLYKVSVAGKIGGASGPDVYVGWELLCTVDGTTSGTQAGVGANWVIVPTSTTSVSGPASAVDNRVVFFDGTSGKLVKDSGLTLAGTNTGDETATSIGALINGATAKTTPVDADFFGLMDSAASNILKKLSWANVKATLKTYFDTIYQATAANLTALAGLTSAADKIPYFTGSGTAALADFTSAGRALVDDADAAAQRATLGVAAAFTTTGVKTNSYTSVNLDRVLIDANGMTASDTFTVNTGTDVVTFATYNPTNGERFTVSSSTTLPAGLVTIKHYYAINSSTNTCKFSLTRGGAAVDITSTGSGTHTATKISSIFLVPASPSNNDTIRFFLQTAHATRCADIDDNGSTVNGGNLLDEALTLCLAGDWVELTYDSTAATWFVTAKNIQPHKFVMERQSAQSINNATETKITSLTAVTNVGGGADTSNNRINIRRRTNYSLTMFVGNSSAVANNGYCVIYKNGTTPYYSDFPVAANAAVYPHRVIPNEALVPGDYLELFSYQGSGGATNTVSSAGAYPQLIALENL